MANSHTVLNMNTHQFHEATQLSDGLRQAHQLVVAGIEDSQRQTTQASWQRAKLVPAATQHTSLIHQHGGDKGDIGTTVYETSLCHNTGNTKMSLLFTLK